MEEPWALGLYRRYYAAERARAALFAAIAEWATGQRRVLYPGSFIHVTASFHFPAVAYVDNNKTARRFFSHRDEVARIIESNKVYTEAPDFTFTFADYENPLPFPYCHFDLLFSLYAGFVSKPCKRYLAPGGILVANDSHGDASLAHIDHQCELIGVVVGSDDTLRVRDDELDQYFQTKKTLPVSEDLLRERRRGLDYVHKAPVYLFRKR